MRRTELTAFSILLLALTFIGPLWAQDTEQSDNTAKSAAEPTMESKHSGADQKADNATTAAEAATGATANTSDEQPAKHSGAVQSDNSMDENSEQAADKLSNGAEADQEQPPSDPIVVEPPSELAGMMAPPTDETLAAVFDAVRQRLPGMPIKSIDHSAVPGMFEVILGSHIVYLNADANLLFQGQLIDLENNINLTESRLTGIHIDLIDELGEENMLVYTANEPRGRSITVFTDINCGYCRLLHSEIETLLAGGVDVRYLMFPRAGLESDSRKALESVWCADNPQEAMTAAKAGEPIVELSCDTPIELHYELAEQVGLRGTPMIFLDNGTTVPGYREANVLVEMINATEPYAN